VPGSTCVVTDIDLVQDHDLVAEAGVDGRPRKGGKREGRRGGDGVEAAARTFDGIVSAKPASAPCDAILDEGEKGEERKGKRKEK